MNEMQQFGEVTVIDCDAWAQGDAPRPDHNSKAQLPQAIGLKTPQVAYHAGAGVGLLGLQMVWPVCPLLPPNVIAQPAVVPVSNPPLLKQFGVPMQGTVGHGVLVPVCVIVGLFVHVREIVFVFQGVHVRDNVGGHVIVGVGLCGTTQHSVISIRSRQSWSNPHGT